MLKDPFLAPSLKRLGLTRPLDVLYHLPFRYEVLTLTKEAPVFFGTEPLNVTGTLDRLPVLNVYSKHRVISFEIKTHFKETYQVLAYNQTYLMKALKLHESYFFRLKYDFKRRLFILVSFRSLAQVSKYPLYPIYSLTRGQKNYEFIRLVEATLKKPVTFPYLIPETLTRKYHLLPLLQALKMIHFPKNEAAINQGYRTLKYYEALCFFLLQKDYQKPVSNDYLKLSKQIDASRVNVFLNHINFPLTNDQKLAIKAIYQDLKSKRLMYRLLVGDVGSGKTIVAFSALFINQSRQMQGALLVPSEVLARQHYENAKAYFKETDLCLIVGGQTAKARNEIKNRLKNNPQLIIIGTHALLGNQIEYLSLGLIIIDEQHKFGVDQRSKLVQKVEAVDLLLMSATPIPRTLSLTLFGDISLSTLKEMPFKTRQVTSLIMSSEFPALKTLIDATLKLKRQVYIIAPRIEGDEASVADLKTDYDSSYPGLVSYLHGRMKREEIASQLQAFMDFKKPILIATSLVEVGIDVKNAGLMIVYHPELFGLSSLHQLRGRIGRDGRGATFIMVSDEARENARLQAILTSNDGYKIATLDQEIRGIGDLNGVRQSGDSNFKYLNIIRDEALITCAKKDATDLKQHISQDKALEAFMATASKDDKVG
ncbi:MAG: DEAD/DEAH box helicase [Erysipelotrichaceae bacterium]|jgi:ATP-dependent DNA helicase RecG|nr:DEAD/DEAH box helicase [Erysipelotrichaceae bacterium]